MNSRLLDKSNLLSYSLAFQHLWFPLQTWMANPIDFLEGDGLSDRHVWIVWISIILSYSIAASTMSSGLSLRNISFRICLVTLIVASTAFFAPLDPSLIGLITEASLAGLFEAWTFDWVLAIPLAVPEERRFAQQVKVLLSIVGGQLLLPRLMHHGLSLPTHTSLGITSNVGIHGLVIFGNAIINEVLIFAFPSTYPRLSVIRVSNISGSRAVVLSKQSTVAPVLGRTTGSEAVRYRVTGIHQVTLWFFLFGAVQFARDVLSTCMHPLLWFESQMKSVNRAEMAQRRVGHAIRLLLLGRLGGFKKLVYESWPSWSVDGVLSVLAGFIDYMKYATMLAWCSCGVYWVYARFIRT